MSADPIVIEDLVKAFGGTRALDGLTCSVRPGEVHGFLGPNGSGKSTTIRIVLGLMRADSGTVRLFGQDPWARAAELHRRLAYVPGDVSLWPQLTGGEAIDVLGRLRGPVDPARRDALVERFDLDTRKKARTYSKGNRQKVALVAALACDAELLILDEPTAGLDPLMEAEFQACIREERDRGRTIWLSSHLLAEVEALCDRVTILRSGVAVESGTLAELRHLTRTSVVAVVDAVPAGIAQWPGVHECAIDGSRVAFQCDDAGLSPALAQLAAAGIRSLHTAPPTLEELFLRHYSPASRTAAGTGAPA